MKLSTKKLAAGILVFLALGVIFAFIFSVCDGVISTLAGAGALVSMVGFSFCCSSYVEKAYYAATGETLSEYFERRHRYKP